MQDQEQAAPPPPPAEAPPPVEEGPGFTESIEGFIENPDPQIVMDVVNAYGLPVLKVLILALAAWIIAGWVKRASVAAMTRAKFDETLRKFFGNLARWTVLTFAFIAILSVFGIDTTSFAAVFAALGLAIGLALQGSLGNAAAGVLLLVFRPFKVGDYVNAGGVAGTVFEIELFTTILNTPDNRRLIVPNGQVFGAVIENVTANPTRRVDVAVGVSYSASIDETRAVLTRAAESIEKRLPDQPVVVMLLDLGQSSVNWSVRVWVATPDFWPTKEALTRAVKVGLDEAGISIPFPQMDVHMSGVLERAG